jgi:polyisoprenoid-binding protein YceI
MNHTQFVRGRATFPYVAGLAIASALFSANAPSIAAQTPKVNAVQLQIADGTTASYRVREQLVGIDFPNDAVGNSNAVTGTLVLAPDGSIDSARSKLTIDAKSLKSDQERRDGYIRSRTLEADKFPTIDFVPRRIQGVPSPLPLDGQAGFQLTGDLTVHGVTKEVTWQGVATFTKDQVAGRATTSFTFETFGLAKPQIARLLSVDDKITLEVEFKMNRS